MQEFDAYDTQALSTRTPSKTLDAHSSKLQVQSDHLEGIRDLMNVAMTRKVVASHRQSPYSSPICSPYFGDLIMESPEAAPHPPTEPRPGGMTTQGILRRRALKRPYVSVAYYFVSLVHFYFSCLDFFFARLDPFCFLFFLDFHFVYFQLTLYFTSRPLPVRHLHV